MSLLFVVVRALPNLTYPMAKDPATYWLIAQGMLHGQKLYRDLWDVKPPGIVWIYELIVKGFAPVGPVNWSMGLVDLVWLLVISYCIFRFAERYLGTAAAAGAVVVNVCWHCRAGYTHIAQTENFLTLLAFASYFAIPSEHAPTRWPLSRHVAAGALLGGAFWMKYNALAFLPFVLLAPYLDPRGLDLEPMRLGLSIPWSVWARRAAAVLAGLTAVVLAVLAYFWAMGLWSVFWRDHVEVVRRYGASARPTGLIEWLVQPIASAIIGLGVWTILAMVAAFIIARRTHEFWRLAPAFLGELGAYTIALSQFRVTSYEFEPCYPFASIIWAYLAVKGCEGVQAMARARGVWGSRPLRASVWILLAAALFWPVRSEVRSLTTGYRRLGQWWRNPAQFYASDAASYPSEELKDEAEVIRFLKQNSAPGDRLYVWGTAPRIYLLTGLPFASRFIPNHALRAVWGAPEWKVELIQDLKKSPPAFVVVARNDANPGVMIIRSDSEHYLQVFPELNAFISEHYHLVTTLHDFVIYRRIMQP